VGALARAGEARTIEKLRLANPAELRGRLVRRYKRFLADVELEDGRVVTVHCPNPGSMKGTNAPGSQVRCSTSDNPTRKLRHTLEMIRVGRIWVGLHASRANALARLALERGAVRELRGYRNIASEVAAGNGSRLDFRLDDHVRRRAAAWVEVKSVTLAEALVQAPAQTSAQARAGAKRARFPDAVTTRGRRHIETLVKLRRRGDRACLLYIVQRGDCDAVEPADDIDPEYAAALRAAARQGVELFALRARVSAKAITLEKRLPVLL
jgi:sugar fermentation stimulation protein A